MRRDDLYIADMLDACDAASSFVAGMDSKEFFGSELHKAAVLQKLTVIGEAASRVSEAVRGGFPQVDWRAIVGFRNIAVHA